jgi:hypothetical protein
MPESHNARRPAFTVTFTVEVSGPDHWQPEQVIAALTKGVRWAERGQQMSGDHGGFAALRAVKVRRG